METSNTYREQPLVQSNELQVGLGRGVVVAAESLQETHRRFCHALMRVCHVVGDAVTHFILCVDLRVCLCEWQASAVLHDVILHL